jgi:hypothetical protein
LEVAQGGDEVHEVFPDEWIDLLTDIYEVLGRFVVVVYPVEEGMPDHLFVQRFAALEEGHGLEEVENRLGFQRFSGEQIASRFCSLRFLRRAEKVALLFEEQIDGLIEASAMDLPDQGRESHNDSSGRNCTREPRWSSHDSIIEQELRRFFTGGRTVRGWQGAGADWRDELR